MSIVGEVIGQRMFKDRLGIWYGNIVKLHNGTLVTYRCGYRRFNDKTGVLHNKIIRIKE